jgi:hypothetical protein
MTGRNQMPAKIEKIVNSSMNTQEMLWYCQVNEIGHFKWECAAK